MDNIMCEVENIDVCLQEILEEYGGECNKAMQRGITKTVKVMRDRTKETAPVDGGKWRGFPCSRPGGTFARHIAYRTRGYGMAFTGIWYVKPEEYRLTHLLEKGHELYVFGGKTGKRTRAIGFVEAARDRAEAEVVQNIIKEIEVI